MSDEQPKEINHVEYLADIAVRLVERDLLAHESWRVAFTIAGMLDSLAASTKGDNSEIAEFAEGIIVDAVDTLLYAHIHLVPTEQDIDAQAKQFSDLFDKAEEFRKNKNNDDEEDK